MASRLALAVAAAVALALVHSATPARAQNGIQTDYSECFAINAQPYFTLPTVCVNFHLDTCDRYLRLNLTVGSTTALDFEVTDIAGWKQCFTPAGASFCTSCLQFVPATTVLTPSYANLCPEVVTSCTVLGITRVISDEKLGCLSLGVNCAEQPSCSACMAASASCGWCGNYTGGSCMLKGASNGGADGPYCATCAASHSQSWSVGGADSCPVNPNAAEDAESWASRNKGVIAGVSVGAFVLFGGVAALCFVRRRRQSRDGQRRGAMPLADMGDSPEPPGGAGNYSVPVVDAPMPVLVAQPTASSASVSASPPAFGTVEPAGAIN